MTCKDCLHYERCKWVAQNIRAAGRTIEFDDDNIPAERYCEHFKNKADVVEVVRCKDCKYYKANSCFNRQWDLESSVEIPLVREDDYCSYGERKCDNG